MTDRTTILREMGLTPIWSLRGATTHVAHVIAATGEPHQAAPAASRGLVCKEFMPRR